MLAQIDKYFNNELSPIERQDFEKRLPTDSELANAVAFYANTRAAAQQVANDTRKSEFEVLRKRLSNRPIHRINSLLWISGITASLILLMGFWWFSHTPILDSEVFVDTYVQEYFENLPVKMDAQNDSLQMGLRLFNERKFSNAQTIFEDILRRKNNDSEAVKYAGITAFRLQNYNKAVMLFQALSQQKELFFNPGKFYEALALMKHQPMNKKEVEKLLKEVIDNNLEGNKEARKILGKKK